MQVMGATATQAATSDDLSAGTSAVTIAAGQDSDSPGAAASDVPPAAAVTPTAGQTLVVYVTGAVKKPGVLRMRAGDRIYQAVDKAGGFKPGAVQEALNLADRLQDGDQIHIPSRREMAAAATGPAQSSSTTPPPVRRAAALLPATTPTRAPGGVTGRAASASARPAGRVLGRPMVAAAPSSGGARSWGSANAPAAPGNGADSGAASQGSSKFKNPGDGVVNINTAGPTNCNAFRASARRWQPR
jgi:hypothetical protein